MLVKVYFEDTDAGGVVYHSNYLKYAERARTEILRSIGYNQKDLLNENIVFVIVKASVSFIKPARLDDELLVETEITAIKKASLVFIHRIYLKNTLLVEVIANVACLYFDSFKIRKIPAQLITRLSKFKQS